MYVAYIKATQIHEFQEYPFVAKLNVTLDLENRLYNTYVEKGGEFLISVDSPNSPCRINYDKWLGFNGVW